VALASFRLPKEESIFITLRRTKHPLRAAFRTIDAADYSEISHVEVVRSLVDSCWDHGREVTRNHHVETAPDASTSVGRSE
jgi:hypothetical protein